MALEKAVLLSSISLSSLGALWIISKDWRHYGLLYLISAAVGEVLCYIFVRLGFYTFPYRLLPNVTPMPIFALLTIFPFYILFGVRFSPQKWRWKIPFYWAIVHIGMTGELLSVNFTRIIQYAGYWDTWDSYTWWWIYVLIFEKIGELIVPESKRKPIDPMAHLTYGKLGWFLIHFILIVTIFLAGYYVGRISLR
ncbi:hypothetical protein D3P08_16090 [Paenibacillus nanensis]|uniref:Uncharacterized protein n=1 Tax=Paenibacillus nanensis TaxID=393251 RepID=A0A3A1USH0_9BACL|nr:CBO0543 family protein [Paenibacillus nanensis]RIX51437.1 hypothetical protein D3P08_16090 [Paenibacillus nanensis]